jgi:hypothetical protein
MGSVIAFGSDDELALVTETTETIKDCPIWRDAEVVQPCSVSQR